MASASAVTAAIRARAVTTDLPCTACLAPGGLRSRCAGLGPAAREYIGAVRPQRQPWDVNRSDVDRVSRGLAMLGDISNRDKHQRLVTASVRWTGQWPRLASLASLQSMPKPADVSGPRDHQGSEVVRCGLRYGEALLFTSGVRHRRYLEFQVNVHFDGSIGPETARCRVAAAAEVLDACLESVDMVVSRFRSDT